MRPSNDDGDDGAVDGLEAGPMTAATWGCCPRRGRPGELLTRGDVCHVHADRAAAERCGVLLGPRSTAWRGRCTSAASGRLRRRPPGLGSHGRAGARTEPVPPAPAHRPRRLSGRGCRAVRPPSGQFAGLPWGRPPARAAAGPDAPESGERQDVLKLL